MTTTPPNQRPAPPADPVTNPSLETSIPLPRSPAPALGPTSPRGRAHRWRLFISALVLVLAFLTASFPARNSDLWFHLATGRLLAQGQMRFGADPFSYTAEGYWANHAWLADLGLYLLEGMLGGVGLVVLKAILVTALAGFMLGVRRPVDSAGVPAFCVTLALLAMSPRLLVQPACASYLLLAVTFWLLWRGQAEPPGIPAFPVRYAIPLVFVLWVNLDEWFFLGPLLTALFWIGERFQGERRTPGWLVPAGLAACLLNPHTFHAFVLPPEFSPLTWASGLRHDARFQAQFASPWQPTYLRAALGLNVPALAYFATAAVGVVSFLINPQSLRGWRLLVWLPFALLAAWQSRTIPFFAVVAAPITTLNLQDWLARREARATRWGASFAPRLGRLILASALLSLIALSLLGWPVGFGREGRPLGWGVQADPSLQRAAETLQSWRRQGLLPGNVRTFTFTPEFAHYSAWFSPGERQYFDHRYHLFATAAGDYEGVCRALLPGLIPAGSPGQPLAGKSTTDWRQVLREHEVGVVLVHDRDLQRVFAVQHELAGNPNRWTLLSVSGQALVYGWNEAPPPGGWAPLAFDAERLAFGAQDEKASRDLPAAPRQGPNALPDGQTLWHRLARRPATPTWESSAASVYLRYFDDSEPWQRRQLLEGALGASAASLAGLPAHPSAVPLVALQLFTSHPLLLPREGASVFLVRDQLGPFFRHLVDRSPALPLLAVRAARRAVATNPQDGNAWLRLGQAFLLLRDATCERSSEGLLPPLSQLRHVQIATALELAVRLDPRFEAAHHELGYLYGERNALDAALDHRRAEAALSRRAGRRPGESTAAWQHRLELLDRDVTKLDELVQQRRDAFAAGSPALQGDRVQQARMALKLGLTRQAADEILLPAPAALLGASGMKLELEVLLSLGRAGDVRTILRDEAFAAGRHALPYHDLPAPKHLDQTPLSSVPYHWPAYEWLDVLQAAAVGDYEQSARSLRVIQAGLRSGHQLLRRQLGELERGDRELLPPLLSGPPALLPAFAAQGLVLVAEQKAALLPGEQVIRAHQADLSVLEGLLALEEGDTEHARTCFAAALRMGEGRAEVAIGFAGRPIAADYLSRGSNPPGPIPPAKRPANR